MPYLVVRGNLGLANTKVYGLQAFEIDALVGHLRFGPRTQNEEEFIFYNSAVFVINQVEYHLGYRVISSASQGNDGQVIWTMFRPPYGT